VGKEGDETGATGDGKVTPATDGGGLGTARLPDPSLHGATRRDDGMASKCLTRHIVNMLGQIVVRTVDEQGSSGRRAFTCLTEVFLLRLSS
jgi:hypothetical protein